MPISRSGDPGSIPGLSQTFSSISLLGPIIENPATTVAHPGHGTTVAAGFSSMSPRRDIDENVWLRPGIEPGSPDLEIGTLPIELHPADSIFTY